MTAVMADDFVVRFDLDDILRGGADDTARALLDTWRTNGGRICDEIAGFTNQLVILDGKPQETDSPQVLFHGANSLLKRNLGNNPMADSPQIKRNDFSADYRRMCAEAYFDTASERQPIFDLVRVSRPMISGDYQQQTYHRLLLPVFTDQGARFTLCYSLDLEPPRYPVASSRQSRLPEAGTAGSINLNMPCFPALHPR